MSFIDKDQRITSWQTKTKHNWQQQAFLQKPSSIIIILIFVNRTLRRIKSSRLIGLVLHAVTLIFFKEHPSHSALCCDISVELSPFAVKSMFWLRSGPITLQEITYPDLVVARTGIN